ncbi:MAG TPA: hypothetical protein VIP51_14110 [Eoetvoesiella sp.]
MTTPPRPGDKAYVPPKTPPDKDSKRPSNPPDSIPDILPGVDPEQTPGIDHLPAERYSLAMRARRPDQARNKQ